METYGRDSNKNLDETNKIECQSDDVNGGILPINNISPNNSVQSSSEIVGDTPSMQENDSRNKSRKRVKFPDGEAIILRYHDHPTPWRQFSGIETNILFRQRLYYNVLRIIYCFRSDL